jgi:hypothetical protein
MADGFQATASPKTKATGGAAVGSAFSIVLIWVLALALNKFGLTLPDNATAAFNTIFTTIVTLAAGYYTPPGVSEGVIVDERSGRPEQTIGERLIADKRSCALCQRRRSSPATSARPVRFGMFSGAPY